MKIPIDINSYSDALSLAADLKKIGALDLVEARLMIRVLKAENKSDWAKVLLSETLGSLVSDSLVEACLLEFNAGIRGYAGKVDLYFDAGSFQENVISFQIVPNKEGLFLGLKNLVKRDYSEAITDRCFHLIIDAMADLEPCDAILRDGLLVVQEPTLQFLNEMAIGNTMTTIDKVLQFLKKKHPLKLHFQKVGLGVLIRAEFIESENGIKTNPVWAKVKKIRDAGSSASFRISSFKDGSAQNKHTESTDSGDKDEAVLMVETRLSSEILFVAQAFEYLRNIEVSELKAGRGNSQTINQCMKIVSKAQRIASSIQKTKRSSLWIEQEIKELLTQMMERFASTHSMAKKQITQIPTRQRRLADAFLSYKDEMALIEKSKPKESSI